MDFGRILKTITNMVLRRGVNMAVNKGVKHLGARGAKTAGPVTSADADQARKVRDTTKRARQAARITRRLGR